MKKIGQLANGSVLIEASQQSLRAITVALDTLTMASSVIKAELTLGDTDATVIAQPTTPLAAAESRTSARRPSGRPRTTKANGAAPHAAGDQRKPACRICGKPFDGVMQAKVCKAEACQKELQRQYQAKYLAKKATKKLLTPAPGRPAVSAPPTDDDSQAKRLAAIRAADARARAKLARVGGIASSDSGIRAASDEDIAALGGAREE